MTDDALQFPNMRLRDMPFKQSCSLYRDIDQLAEGYLDEIITAFSDLIKGETNINSVKLLIYRAQYACYLRGYRDRDAEHMPAGKKDRRRDHEKILHCPGGLPMDRDRGGHS